MSWIPFYRVKCALRGVRDKMGERGTGGVRLVVILRKFYVDYASSISPSLKQQKIASLPFRFGKRQNEDGFRRC